MRPGNPNPRAVYPRRRGPESVHLVRRRGGQVEVLRADYERQRPHMERMAREGNARRDGWTYMVVRDT